ncbi:MAG: hypothetical protein EON94_10810, partial [Caulobacteraceae bacterium]
MDPPAPNPVDPPSRAKMVDTVIQIGLLGLLIYACARIVLPFAGILAWSMVLAVMLHPLHVRLAQGWERPEAADAIRRALVLLADHELNASTFAARVTVSTGASLWAGTMAGLAALSGP